MEKSKVLWLAMALAACAAGLFAHPMGNFSVNHYARVEPAARGVEVLYVLDLAEIPTFELLQKWNLTATSPRDEIERQAATQAREWAQNLSISANGRTVAPQLRSTKVTMTDGAGGMQVMRVSMQLHLPIAQGKLEYEDHNYAERAGWKEIVITAGEGTAIESATQGDVDRSQALTAYPQDPTVAPPQDVRASLEWTTWLRRLAASKKPPIVPAPAVAAPASAPSPTAPVPPQGSAPGTVVRGDFLSQLLNKHEISVGMVLIGLAVAFGLGAIHAMSPGHGKTIVAAYLVGSRGTFKHAIFLGGMVTFTHTISVFLPGIHHAVSVAVRTARKNLSRAGRDIRPVHRVDWGDHALQARHAAARRIAMKAILIHMIMITAIISTTTRTITITGLTATATFRKAM